MLTLHMLRKASNCVQKRDTYDRSLTTALTALPAVIPICLPGTVNHGIRHPLSPSRASQTR